MATKAGVSVDWCSEQCRSSHCVPPRMLTGSDFPSTSGWRTLVDVFVYLRCRCPGRLALHIVGQRVCPGAQAPSGRGAELIGSYRQA